jgi:hypothetical protein
MVCSVFFQYESSGFIPLHWINVAQGDNLAIVIFHKAVDIGTDSMLPATNETKGNPVAGSYMLVPAQCTRWYYTWEYDHTAG